MRESGKRRAAGSLERRVLVALWADGTPLTGGQVLDALGDKLAYTTVLTILGRLVEKGQVARDKAGAAFVYRPLLHEDAEAARQFGELLYAGADRRAVLRGFVQAMSDADADVLRQLLDDPDASSHQSLR